MAIIVPAPSLWSRIDALARASFPALSTVLIAVALAAPLDLPGQAELQLAAVLIAVFFWSLFRPHSMPPSAVFLIGFAFDLVGNEPFGVSILLFLIAYAATLSWRRELLQRGFFPIWGRFMLVAVICALLQWLLSSVLSLRLMPLAPPLFLAALASGLYPALHKALNLARRRLAPHEEF